ncbi:response regulator transcription factor [Nocardioides sp. KR10-350]|uniref:response regulator transcription factor n=1 Tax=Nocardioides cheoyonin TaxID=3156615 RepID=UPI0032B375A3
MTSVLIVDDQALVRGGFRLILATTHDLEVVGEAADGAEGVRLARRLRPDVVLMDVRMPGMDGLEATKALLADPGAAYRILILTTFDLDEYVYRALRAGAAGFLLKDASPESLVDAVRTVARGDRLLAPAVLTRLVEEYVDRPRPDGARQLAALTEREREILVQVGQGLSNLQIAEALHLSEATVKTHVTRVFTKLGLRDRAQAVVAAYETGLVRVGQGRPPGAVR